MHPRTNQFPHFLMVLEWDLDLLQHHLHRTVRELIGAGSIFGKQILPLADAAAGKMGYEPVTIFILAPGAFFVLAFLSALQNKFKIGAAKRGIDPSNPDCKGGCASCGNSMCSGKRG